MQLSRVDTTIGCMGPTKGRPPRVVRVIVLDESASVYGQDAASGPEMERTQGWATPWSANVEVNQLLSGSAREENT